MDLTKAVALDAPADIPKSTVFEYSTQYQSSITLGVQPPHVVFGKKPGQFAWNCHDATLALRRRNVGHFLARFPAQPRRNSPRASGYPHESMLNE